jgi:magnesium transporter
MAFTAYHLTQSGDLRSGLNEEQIRSAFTNKDGVLWADICETTEEDGRFLERVFGFHHLVIEDCLSKRLHPPKIDDFGDYIFIVVHGIDYTTETNVVGTTEMQIFLGAHFVVSSHATPLFSVEAVRRLVEEHGHPMRRGADFLAHALVDALIDNILPTIDAMGERANDIEEEVIRNPQRSTLEAILHLKRSALQLHRIAAPQRDVMNRLSRQEFSIVSNEARVFYRDSYDHILRIEDLNQSLRDRAADALSTYLSVVANRQNETMRVLSIVAAIFLPLMLLAGIYGMNFEQMPELKWGWSYYAVLGLMGTLIVGALLWFRARAWITWGQQGVTRLRPFMVDRKSLVGYLEHMSMPSRRNRNRQPAETESPGI